MVISDDEAKTKVKEFLESRCKIVKIDAEKIEGRWKLIAHAISEKIEVTLDDEYGRVLSFTFLRSD